LCPILSQGLEKKQFFFNLENLRSFTSFPNMTIINIWHTNRNVHRGINTCIHLEQSNIILKSVLCI
jgi:hypothetical protein